MNYKTDTHSAITNETPKSEKTTNDWKSWAIFIVLAVVLYFGNTELQSYLGRRALDKVDFPEITLQQAFAQAKATNKLVLADISAIWCPSCRKLDSQVLSQPEVKSVIDENYVFVRIEYETEAGEAFKNQYQVRGFPTLLVLSPDGAKLRNLGLTFNPEEFIQRL